MIKQNIIEDSPIAFYQVLSGPYSVFTTFQGIKAKASQFTAYRRKKQALYNTNTISHLIFNTFSDKETKRKYWLRDHPFYKNSEHGRTHKEKELNQNEILNETVMKKPITLVWIGMHFIV